MTNAPDIAALLDTVTQRLAAVSESPRLDAELLLGRAIDMPRSYLFAHPEDAPDAAAVERLERTVARRLAGEPMAYITGHARILVDGTDGDPGHAGAETGDRDPGRARTRRDSARR